MLFSLRLGEARGGEGNQVYDVFLFEHCDDGRQSTATQSQLGEFAQLRLHGSFFWFASGVEWVGDDVDGTRRDGRDGRDGRDADLTNARVVLESWSKRWVFLFHLLIFLIVIC